MIIAGAGLAGLLAANMLHYLKPVVYEAQDDIPNNHSAVLRFKESTFGDVCSIPFKEVKLTKAVIPWRNPVADALAYADKNNGVARNNRSITMERDNGVRYIAPANLIESLAGRVRLRLGMPINFAARTIGVGSKPMQIQRNEPIISTIPMSTLMDQLEWPHKDKVQFSHQTGVHVHAKIENCDAYVGLQFPDPALPFSRVSVTGNDLIVEGSDKLDETCLPFVAEALGFKDEQRFTGVSVHRQRYAKINPINDAMRKEFIHWASVAHNIFSLGRFATWRPGLQLDSLVNDVRLIEKWAVNGDLYSLKRNS